MQSGCARTTRVAASRVAGGRAAVLVRRGLGYSCHSTPRRYIASLPRWKIVEVRAVIPLVLTKQHATAQEGGRQAPRSLARQEEEREENQPSQEPPM
uniref:Uncharacterized protein n=1 Tax=Setaria italica TaxID=4555 RepID=K3YX31_SETIT